jgi:hypothetical protein
LLDPAQFSAGVEAALSHAIGNVELWTPVVRSLTELLIRDGRLTGAQMINIAESSNTSGGLTTGDRLGGPARPHLEDYELKPASLRERRRGEKKQLN